MRKQAEVGDDNRIKIIPEYGRQRLLSYAESFRDLADLFEQDEEDLEHQDDHKKDNRLDYLWQRKLQENQELLAEHLKEMAHIMAEVAKETCRYHPMGERRFFAIFNPLLNLLVRTNSYFINLCPPVLPQNCHIFLYLDPC